MCLEDKFEVIKDIGDGSFGSVTLGRTRSAGAHLVRRNTLVSYRRDQYGQLSNSLMPGGYQDHEEDL